MSLLETAVEDLKMLPPQTLSVAVKFIHGLREMNTKDRLVSLERAGGALSAEEADAMDKALHGCRQIDASEW